MQSSICTGLLKRPGENEPVHTENGLSCVVSIREKVEGWPDDLGGLAAMILRASGK